MQFKVGLHPGQMEGHLLRKNVNEFVSMYIKTEIFKSVILLKVNLQKGLRDEIIGTQNFVQKNFFVMGWGQMALELVEWFF